MRRAIVLECIVLAVVTAVALAGGGRSAAPAAVPVYPPVFRPSAPFGTPPCIRESPGGRCILVCRELVGDGPACPHGRPRLVPVRRP